jgi:hypothetical protein
MTTTPIRRPLGRWLSLLAATLLLPLLLAAACLPGQEATDGRGESDVQTYLDEQAAGGRLAPAVLADLRASGAADALVTLDGRAADEAARQERAARGLVFDDAAIVEQKATIYAETKARVLGAAGEGVRVLNDYRLLPVLFVRIDRPEALAALLQQPEVVSVRANEVGGPAGR